MRFKHISKDRNCPQCGSTEVFRMRRTGIALKLVCNVTNLRPHWCSECDSFFLAPKQNKTPHITSQMDLNDRKNAAPPQAGREHLAH